MILLLLFIIYLSYYYYIIIIIIIIIIYGCKTTQKMGAPPSTVQGWRAAERSLPKLNTDCGDTSHESFEDTNSKFYDCHGVTRGIGMVKAPRSSDWQNILL